MEVSKSDKESDKKSDKNDKSNKALFSQRLIAYLVDYLIISVIAAFIACAFIDADKMLSLNEKLEKVTNEIATSEKLDTLKYEEYIDACYDVARYQGIITLSELGVIIMYFVVYQIYNNGQTIGKKLTKIRVVSRKDELTMNQMIFRTCLSTTMVVNLLSLLLMSFVSKYVYFYGVLVIELIFNTIFLISVGMVMFSKTGFALHDKFFNTEVVKIN